MKHLLAASLLLALFCSSDCLPVALPSAPRDDGVSRIIGGSDASINRYPWQVSLMRRTSAGWYHSCGGSIYNKNWIITAAHCVDDLSVVLGTVRSFLVVAGKSTLLSFANSQVRYVTRLVVHRGWNRAALQNDIAVLKLHRALIMKSWSAPYPVAMPRTDAPENIAVVATGWGRTSTTSTSGSSTLQAVTMYVKPRVCTSTYGSVYQASTMLCTWGSYRSTCMGDSGGPIVKMTRSNRGILYGITSWGAASCKGPSVSTKVYPYVAWIRQNAV